MSNLKEYLDDGLANPFMFTSDADALCEACEAVSVFMNAASPIYARTIALTNAGRLVGGMTHGEIRNKIMDILQRCCNVPEDRVINLSVEEEKFINAGMDKRVYR